MDRGTNKVSNIGGGCTLSMRGGVVVLKSISLFLANGRGRNVSEKSAGKLKKARRMSEKEKRQKINARIIEAAKKDTHFSKSEIDALYDIYNNLLFMNRNKPSGDKLSGGLSTSIIRQPTKVHEGINRTIFCELLHNTFDIVTEDKIMDRIFCVWDKDNQGLLTPHEWFTGLSVFLKGTLVEQTEFCFSVYDLNNDGFITKDEMFQLLRNCLIKHPQDEDPDEGVKELVEIVAKKLDKDKDGKVSLEDFKKSVEEEPLLIEAFGPCLPTERAKTSFLTTLKA